jgi:hypothetical protein
MIRHLMDYKMINLNDIMIKYYQNEYEKGIKYYMEDLMGSVFFNKINVIYNNGIFNAYLKENSNMIDLNLLINNNITIIPREIFIQLFNERYIFVDINSDFPEYKKIDLPDDYDPDFNYIPKVKKK